MKRSESFTSILVSSWTCAHIETGVSRDSINECCTYGKITFISRNIYIYTDYVHTDFSKWLGHLKYSE